MVIFGLPTPFAALRSSPTARRLEARAPSQRVKPTPGAD